MILRVLLDAVADVADRLRHAASIGDDNDGAAALPPASQLENVAYVLDCAEHVLAADNDGGSDHRGGTGSDRGGVVAVDLRRRLSSQLDLSLRHVASAFPLFAYRVWQLGGLVDSRLRSGDDEDTTADLSSVSTTRVDGLS